MGVRWFDQGRTLPSVLRLKTRASSGPISPAPLRRPRTPLRVLRPETHSVTARAALSDAPTAPPSRRPMPDQSTRPQRQERRASSHPLGTPPATLLPIANTHGHSAPPGPDRHLRAQLRRAATGPVAAEPSAQGPPRAGALGPDARDETSAWEVGRR